MTDFKVVERDLLVYLSPSSVVGACAYLALFVLAALVLSRMLRAAVHAAMTRGGHLDRTTISFLQQIGTALIWVMMLILYAHLIPVLRSLGTALLAGASVASVVLGLAAQSTLGNLIAGVSITIYRPFRLGDMLQVTAPTGTDVGVVELISLGYTTLRTPDGRSIVLPNSLAASQVNINLNNMYRAGAITIGIQLGRDVEVEDARRRALAVADGMGGAAPASCYLSKVEAGTFTLQLHLAAADSAGRDALRSATVAKLAESFGKVAAGGAGAASNAAASVSIS